ncbi:hypothetical protein LIER_38713 [Lithospermum erythrorhizon]|uniref:Uncharacterized protein n=1 Tax=Lithospermum erythrorhizon TaxID=34254 RepID=A0AAV3Q3Q0_LITER
MGRVQVAYGVDDSGLAGLGKGSDKEGLVLSPIEEEGVPAFVQKSSYASMVTTLVGVFVGRIIVASNPAFGSVRVLVSMEQHLLVDLQLVIHLRQDKISGPKPFKYHSFWQGHPSYESVVDRGWLSRERGGTPLELLLARNMHQISMLMGEDGQVCTDAQVVEAKIIKFYVDLFTSKCPLSEVQRQIIWSVIAEGDVPSSVNATTLSLIPKVEYNSSVKEDMPISCCNNIYKTITKILMNRMSRLMHRLVSPSQ